jgi:hypothetical protein
VSADERVERALEVLVYAPLGFGLWLKDLAPSLVDTMVARGRAEVDRRQEQAQERITTAKSMGQVAIAFGVPELKKRAERQVSVVREQADRIVENFAPPRSNGAAAPAATEAAEPTPPPRHAPAPDAEPAPPAKPATAKAVQRSSSSAHLPIPGYDALSASQVVERLAGLGQDDLGAVRDYELANRKRRTILGKIDQLTS